MSMYKKGIGKRGKEKGGGESDKEEKKVKPAALRLLGEFTDLDVPKHLAKLNRDDKDPFNFSFVLTPDSGYWKGGMYEFKVQVPSDYPYKPPIVRCIDKIYHPNIAYTGEPCVNALRPWKATNTIQMVLFGLLFLFTDSNPNDVLEKEPAEVMRKDLQQFIANVKASMRGQTVNGVPFPKNRGLK
jgi:ubiquitin-conjugating enzyme E2 M